MFYGSIFSSLSINLMIFCLVLFHPKFLADVGIAMRCHALACQEKSSMKPYIYLDVSNNLVLKTLLAYKRFLNSLKQRSKMARTSSSSTSFSSYMVTVTLALLLIHTSSSSAHLSTDFYDKSCPQLFGTVKSVVQSAIAKERRMGASLVRLFFHDCFVKVILFSSV